MSDPDFAQKCVTISACTYIASFVAVCIWMVKNRSWWFDYIAIFCLFGTTGGWMYHVAIASPPVGFMTFISLAYLSSSIILTFKKSKTQLQWVLLAGGYLHFLAIFGIAAFSKL